MLLADVWMDGWMDGQTDEMTVTVTARVGANPNQALERHDPLAGTHM